MRTPIENSIQRENSKGLVSGGGEDTEDSEGVSGIKRHSEKRRAKEAKRSK